MSAEFSGEQKLRIVLESIIRNVPKGEQSKKYGVTEEEFQSWHDHLIKNGGKIFDSSSTLQATSRSKKKKMSPFAKVFLSISLLANLGLVTFGFVYQANKSNSINGDPDDFGSSIDSPINLVDNFPNDPISAEISNSKGKEDDEPIDVLLENSRVKPLRVNGQDDAIENLLAVPDLLPAPSLLPPVEIPEPAEEVTFLGKSYKGKHVVYLLDAGTYVLDGNQSIEQFTKIKEALISSILTLSPNSYFNLVLYWNLREASALGKTILMASQQNKKYAIEWIGSLGDTKESIKADRNQYYPKELLYAKPAIGIIGPWYGLSTAISYDPDIVFVLAGNLPGYDRSEVPRSHYAGLGKINFKTVQEGTKKFPAISELSRETARKWFYSITPISSLPSSDDEVDTMAFARLGFASSSQNKFNFPPSAWNKSFDNFLTSLEVGFDRIPQTHFMVSLPKYVSWPSSLLDTAKEFTESSRGSFQQNLFTP